MAARIISLAPTYASDAEFRAWGKAVSDAFAAGGWVQTSDTGQINWATVSRPPSTSTVQGYEIWRMDDAAGGLHNAYIKIDYGSSSSFNSPGIGVQIGWGSNGSGALTGNTNTRQIITIGASATSTTYPSLFSVGAGYACFMLFSSYASGGMLFSIERTRDATGAVEDQVFVFGQGYNSSGQWSQTVPLSGTASTVNTLDLNNGGGMRKVANATATYSGSIGLSTIAPQKGGWLMEAMNLFGGDSTNYNAFQQQYSIMVYGSTHNYIVASTTNVLTTGVNPLMRYE